MDELNQHECMATLTALVKHLDHTISPVDSVSVNPLVNLVASRMVKLHSSHWKDNIVYKYASGGIREKF